MLFLRFLFTLLLTTNFELYGITIDFNQITKEIPTDKKSVIIFFHTEHCPYCQKMIKEQFDNPINRKKIEKDFYFIDINLDLNTKIIYKNFSGTALEFANLFDVKFYPTILFMKNNIVVSSIKGYRNPNKFDLILKYISTGSYESMDLETFINELEMLN